MHSIILLINMQTRRERIIELLENIDSPVTIKVICTLLDIKEQRVVEEDLTHIAQSIKRRGKRLVMHPASCAKCGFSFKTRKVKAPSKCPRCKSEWILPASFIIVD